MPIDNEDMIPIEGTRGVVDTEDLMPSGTKAEVPHSWVQGSEPSLYDKFMRIFDDPEKESAKAVTALVNANAFNITPSQAYEHHEELQKMTKGQKLQKPRIGTAFKEGVQESTPGIIYSQKIPDFEPLGTWEEIAYGFGSILSSLPIYAAGYTIGGGNPLTGTAGAFALDAGIRQVYIDKIQKGEISSFAEFTQRLDSAVRETAKGEITGILTGAAGMAVPAKARLLTELGTMTTVGSLLDGRIPGIKDFIHGLAVLGLLHVSGKAPNVIKNKAYEMFKKDNSHPINLANEVNKRIEDYEFRPITDILLDLEPTKEAEVYRYAPGFKGEKSPVVKTVEQLLAEIESHRDAVVEGKEGNKEVHDNAVRKLFEYDQYRAVKEWNDTQKVEAITKMLEDIEFEEWNRKSQQPARKPSQETPPSVASAEPQEPSGQVPKAIPEEVEVKPEAIADAWGTFNLSEQNGNWAYRKGDSVYGKSFKTKQEAIDYKNKVEETNSKASSYVDEPSGIIPDEKKVKRISPDTAVKNGMVYLSYNSDGSINLNKSGILYHKKGSEYYIGGDDNIKAKAIFDNKGFGKVSVMSKEDFDTITAKPETPNALAEPEPEMKKAETKGEALPKFKSSEEAQKAIDMEHDKLGEKYTFEQVNNALLNLELKDEGFKWETPVKEEEVVHLNELYKARQKIDKVDLSTWRETVVKNSGLEAKEVDNALSGVAYDVPSTADFLRTWGTQITSNLSRIYNSFAKPRDIYTNTHAEFRWGGTADNPILEGIAFDSDLIRVPFDKEALKKTEKLYNAIAETQGHDPISLSKIEKQQTSTKTRQIEDVSPTASTPDKATSPDAPTSEIITKEGKDKAKRGVSDILSDVNEALGKKGAVGDLKTEEKQREARERLRNDVRKMSEAAKEANLELPEFMKQLGIKKEDIDKLLVYAPIKEKKSIPTMSYGSDPIIKQRNLGSQKNPRFAPALTESDRIGIKGLKDIETGIFGDATVNPIYSFKELGQWAMDKFYWPIVNAHDAAKREYIVIEKEIKDIKKSLPYASAKRIGTYAISVQEHGMAKLKAMKVKEIPTLTEQEISAYNRMRELYKQYYERIQEARLLAGKELFPETKDYFTFVHEISFLDKLGLNPILGKKEALRRTIDLDVAKSIHLKATRFGSEKKRINALYNMNLDAFNIFLRYSDIALNHIHKSPEIAKMREMLLRFPKEKGEQVGFKLSEHAPNTHGMITEWLDYQAGQKPFTRLSKAPLVENTLKALNRNLTFAILSASLRSIAIQPSSLHAVVVDIGTGYVKRGVFELFDKDRVAFAMKESKHLTSREFDVNVADASQTLLETASNIKQAAGDIGMAPMKYVDLKAATATWLGAYAKAIEIDKMNHADAVKFADFTTITTQASALPMDVAPIQRSTLGKTLSVFQTFTINHWNWINNNMLDNRGDKLSKKEIAKKIATYVTAATLINVLYEDVLGMNSPLPSPINAGLEALEEGEDFMGVSKRIAYELATIVPGLGGMRYGSTPLGATVDLVGDISEEGLTTRNATKLLGIPGSQQMIRLSKGEI